MPNMSKRTLMIGLSAAGVVRAQTRTRVVLTTALGAISLDLAPEQAPITCANFLRYVDTRRFDGASFYRAVHAGAPGAATGLVQGGLKNDPAKVFPPITHEPTSKSGLHHVDGTVSMARYDPGTAQAEFFICVGDQTYLDADPSQPGDNLGFAAFGRVAEGMDVARQILAAPTSPTQGEGVMRGQMLSPMVEIVSARRV